MPDWQVSERTYTMGDILEAYKEGRLIEAFGCGTAAVVSPVQSISFKEQEIHFPLGKSGKAGELTQHLSDTLLGIQYGDIPSDWSVVI